MFKKLWYENSDFYSLQEKGITGKFLFLREAVIYVDEYLKTIKKDLSLILNFLKTKKYNYDEIVELFEKTFSKYDFQFDYSNNPFYDVEYTGIEEMKCFSNKDGFPILITFNNNLIKGVKSDEFLNKFLSFIEHELIHRGQFLRIKNIDIYNRNERIKKEKDAKKRYNQLQIGQKYYSDYAESMTFAKQAIEEFRFLGYTDSQIINFLKNIQELQKEKIHGNTFLYNIYMFLNYPEYKKAYNQFLNYCFQYLQKN